MTDRMGAVAYSPGAHRASGMYGVPSQASSWNTVRQPRSSPPPSFAGLTWERAPILIPLAAKTAPVTVGRAAFRDARRAGVAVQGPLPGVLAEPRATSLARTVAAQEQISRSAPVSPWGKPRAWTPDAASPARGRSALVMHSPAVSIHAPSSLPAAQQESPTQAPRKPKTWATPRAQPARTMDQLYADAHERFDAPLTVPVGLVNQGNSCFASVVRRLLTRFCKCLSTAVRCTSF